MSAPLSRRQFFPMLIQELIVNIGATKGKLAYSLDELDKLPPEKIAVIRPMINPACQIRVINKHVCSQFRDPPNSPITPHFPTTPEFLAVFNRFNGKQSIGEIAEIIANEHNWEAEDTFNFVRDLFLLLAKALVIVPQNPLDADLEMPS